MNPLQVFTVKKMLIGALFGLVCALQMEEKQLRPRAIAYQRTALDLRAIHHLRELAAGLGFEPDLAEDRYWLYVSDGYGELEAADEVSAELRSA